MFYMYLDGNHGNRCMTPLYTGTTSSKEEASVTTTDSLKLPTCTTNQGKKGESDRQGDESGMNRKKQKEAERDREIGSDSSEKQRKRFTESEQQRKTKKSRVTSAGTFCGFIAYWHELHAIIYCRET